MLRRFAPLSSPAVSLYKFAILPSPTYWKYMTGPAQTTEILMSGKN
ncbi:hypothetical protein M7I_6553 [Glarea lozoyensis 74030]|uniref:Uncharacterized protein n=1 Tax=Glarea lozoyensis (strain ATCC 74030 / MF5533) TaxID=1104152 RepID=H0EUW3_GLAL7|nr:hypothetical protein M7I_6553 [Glarea lozoyensis 74030]